MPVAELAASEPECEAGNNSTDRPRTAAQAVRTAAIAALIRLVG